MHKNAVTDTILLINQNNNDQFEIIHEFAATNIDRIQLVLEAYHEINSFYNGELLFSLKSINIISTFSHLKLSKCIENSPYSVTNEENKQKWYFLDYNLKERKNGSFSYMEELLLKYHSFIKNTSDNIIFLPNYIDSLTFDITKLVIFLTFKLMNY